MGTSESPGLKILNSELPGKPAARVVAIPALVPPCGDFVVPDDEVSHSLATYGKQRTTRGPIRFATASGSFCQMRIATL